MAQYQALGCELKTIDQSTETFELINEFVFHLNVCYVYGFFIFFFGLNECKRYVNNQRGTYFDRHKIVEAFEVNKKKINFKILNFLK